MSEKSDKTDQATGPATTTNNNWLYKYRYVLGPGLLFAADSIGTSHLVQATRAGADYGLALMGVVLLFCAIKYPAFRFGADYGAETGQSLLESYFKQGKWAVLAYMLELGLTMFVSVAAVAVVTAGLVNILLPWSVSDIAIACVILFFSAVLLVSGRYHLLEKVTKVMVVLFTLFIIAAALLSTPKADWSFTAVIPPTSYDSKDVLFLIALAGWMPTAIGVSVWQSLWVGAKSKELGRPVTLAEARFDFNLGYIFTAILAVGFLIMGAALMHQQNLEFADSSVGFGGQLIDMFTSEFGSWAYPFISLSAIAVMFSTVLTLMDACPRAFGAIFERWKENARVAPTIEEGAGFYTTLIIIEVIGAGLILLFLMNSFKTFIDFATSVAFLTAPLLAFFNHRAITSDEVPEYARPSQVMKLWSLSGVVIMSSIMLCYIYFIMLA